MTDIADTIQITSADTWTEVAGADGTSKTAIGATHRANLDLTVTNLDADPNSILVAITPDSTAPSADTEAFYKGTLTALAAGVNSHVATFERVFLPAGAHLWLKSDQTDTRVLVNGETEATS